MSDSPSKLCPACEGFDVRSLLETAEEQKARSDRRTGLVRPGLKRFFAQHRNLKELRDCADTESCDLCLGIWMFPDNARFRLRDDELSDEEWHRGVNGLPIFFGTDDRNISHHESMNMIVQQLSNQTPTKDADTSSDSDLMGRVQAQSSNDDQVFELAKHWIHDCKDTHDSCKLDGELLHRPTRLLKLDAEYCTDARDYGRLRVQLVDGLTGTNAYAALSYCWGGQENNFFVLNSTSEPELRAGIGSASLPATLRDAVITTSRLELELLWIDALCIKQDDDSDWAQESGRMGDIYRGAAVTIEAAAANTASDGFLKNRVNAMPYCRLAWRVSDRLGCVQLRPVGDLTTGQLFQTRLYSRGWTLQERLLASRTLSFGTQQITFECMDGYREEGRVVGQPVTLTRARVLSKAILKRIRNPHPWHHRLFRFVLRSVGLYPSFQMFNRSWMVEPGLHMPYGDGDHSVQSYREIWARLIRLYSQRSFSNNFDRLPAISGLAAVFQCYIDDVYVAGLWKSDLVIGLGWESRELTRIEVNKEIVTPSMFIEEKELVEEWPYGIRNQTNAYTPSWTWASVRGPVILHDDRRHDIVGLGAVVDVSIQPKFSDPNGLLAAAYIDFRAPLLAIPDPRLPLNTVYKCTSPRLFAEVQRLVKHTSKRAPEFYQQHRAHVGQHFSLVKLYQWNLVMGSSRNPHLQLLFIESCVDGSFRRLTSFQLSCPTTDQEFVNWHSRIRPQSIALDDYLRLYHDDMQKAKELAAELNSSLWEERLVRLV